ncbi:MAG: hypothetical protein AB1742_05870, partial [bacterium]
MRAVFAATGLLFDALIFAVSLFIVYCFVRPEALGEFFDAALDFADDPAGRFQLLGAGVVLFFLSLLSLYILLFGREEKAFTVYRGEGGAVTVSRHTLNRVLEGVVKQKTSGGRFVWSAFSRRGGGLAVRMKVQVDLLNKPLKDYASQLSGSVKDHFRDYLGIELSKVDVKVE